MSKKHKRLEEAFISHMDKEESSFKTISSTLLEIKESLHDTALKMTEHDATHSLRLMETKSEILKVLFDRMVEKNTFEHEISKLNLQAKELEVELKTGLDAKVDKRVVNIIWIVLTTVVVISISFFKLKG